MGYRIQRSFLLLLFAVVGVCLVVFGAVTFSFAQQADPGFQVREVLRNEANPSVVAFTLYGTFEDQDVVNLYSNDVFIKAKAINTPALVGTKEITIDNISVDVFQTGDNLIVAKIERAGSEIVRTAAFRLTVQEPPTAPTIVPLVNHEEGKVGLNITGSFRENDIVRVFLNDNEVRAKTITAADAGDKTIQVVGISIDTLVIGNNFFTVSIRRGEHESDRSEKSTPVVIEEPEVEPEPAPLLQCASYDTAKPLYAERFDAYEGFGNALSVKSGVLAVATRGEQTYLYTKGKDEGAWQYAASLAVPQFKRSGSTRKSVVVKDAITVLVGDSGSGYVAASGGAVRVYQRVGEVWTAYDTIAPIDLEHFESFGSSMALHGNTLAVGALREDSSGAVYVYSLVNGRWVKPFRLIPTDSEPNQEFGHSISVSADGIAVGAPGDGFGRNGAVYLYTRVAGEWVVEKIVAGNRRLSARFGQSVLLVDGVLFVGAMRDDQGKDTLNSGVVYVYTRQGGEWQVAQKLVPPADDTGGEFGAALARWGNMLAVGVPRSDVGRKNAGAVYVYKQTTEGSAWSFEKVVVPEGLA